MNPQGEYNVETSSDTLGFILVNAIQSHASDIHIEPGRDRLTIRFRVDGFLQIFQDFDIAAKDNLISRIKVLCKLDITEHRFPLDGHFEFKYQEKIYNIRVSTTPSIYGETTVCRILNREESLIAINQLGFEPDQYEIISKMIHSPSGMILTTGPTGSGKTALLYSIISALNSKSRSIITIEDPIEVQLANATQVQVNDNIKLTFAMVMRSVVRQDPDVIMLGEIRDSDTAQISILSALSGILVLSTFHTFDVPALSARFMEMGVTSSVLAQAIRGVISTRLVRKVCESCKAPYVPNDMDKQLLQGVFATTNFQSNFQKGKGCPDCNNTGYKGRIGIYEVVYFDKDIRASIIEHRPVAYIYDLLKSKKVKSLNDAAMLKVLQGKTTFEEVNRVVGVALPV